MRKLNFIRPYFKQNSSLLRILVFLTFVTFVILYHAFGYIGHFGYDDLHYAKLASDLNLGVYDSFDHYSYRWSILTFTALGYKLFGINDLASSLPTMLLFISILGIVSKVLQEENILVLILGLSMTCFSQWFLFYSDMLMPDMYVAFSISLALFAFWKSRFGKYKRDFLYASIMSFSLFFGFISKGTIILALPLIIYLFIVDVLLRRKWLFWIYTILTGLVFLFFYFLTVWHLTGNVFSRFNALESNTYLSLCSYAQQPMFMVIERISIGFLKLLVNQGSIIGVVLILAFLVQRGGSDLMRFDTPFSFYLISSVILLLSGNFMSISLSEYSPMCLDTRHYLFIIPVLAIPSSRIIYHFIIRRMQGIQILILLLLAFLTTYFLPGSSHAEIYFLLFLLFAIKFFIPTTFRKPIYFVLAFVTILLLIPAQMMLHAQKVNYRMERNTIMNQVISRYQDSYIVTDDIQSRLGNYYTGFGNSGPLFVSYKDLNWQKISDKKKYILVNNRTAFLGQEEIPFYTLIAKSNQNSLFLDSVNNLSLFTFEKLPIKTLLLESKNGFEKDVNYWESGDFSADAEPVYKGHKSNKIHGFSSIFRYSFDSLYNAEPKSLLISLKFQCLYTKPTEAQIIVILQNNETEYRRDARLFNQYIKSIDHWWMVEKEFYISSSEIKRNSQLIIYVWNPQEKLMYLDDFNISINQTD